jgi:hypothetical protein
MKENIINAKVASTFLGFEGHGLPTLSLTFELQGGGMQGSGGYHLGGGCMHQQVTGILKALDIESWDQIKGQNVRVKKAEGYHGKIIAVGHFMNEQWHDFQP